MSDRNAKNTQKVQEVLIPYSINGRKFLFIVWFMFGLCLVYTLYFVYVIVVVVGNLSHSR